MGSWGFVGLVEAYANPTTHLSLVHLQVAAVRVWLDR